MVDVKKISYNILKLKNNVLYSLIRCYKFMSFFCPHDILGHFLGCLLELSYIYPFFGVMYKKSN